jgi:ribosomal protein S12 methylthiotransferase accessory factor
LDPSQQMRWVVAQALGDGRRLWAPFDSVSIDFTRSTDDRLDRSSNGMGARFDRDGARTKALLELVERDAVWAWLATPLSKRSLRQLDEATVPYGWFEDLCDKCNDCGLYLSIYRLPALIRLPVFFCELYEPRAGAVLRRRSGGVGCALQVEQALLAAVVEAAQSRLTSISGVRDDLPATDPGGGVGLGWALPPSADDRLRSWDESVAMFTDKPLAGVEGVADLLARRGYPDLAFVDLSRPGRPACVVKAFAPGLGALSRSRRPPAASIN